MSWRSLRMVYSACNRSARSTCSGGIDGGPIAEYKAWKRGESSTSRRIHQTAHRAQRVIRGNPVLDRPIAEEDRLPLVGTAHGRARWEGQSKLYDSRAHARHVSATFSATC